MSCGVGKQLGEIMFNRLLATRREELRPGQGNKLAYPPLFSHQHRLNALQLRAEWTVLTVRAGLEVEIGRGQRLQNSVVEVAHHTASFAGCDHSLEIALENGAIQIHGEAVCN